MLSGKNVSVSPFINALRHGVNGNCTPKDLETALQLTYLYFADPRFDQSEYDQGIKQLKAILPNYILRPDYKFSQVINEVLYGDNPRHKFLSEAVVDNASLATIEKNYRMLFNDAAGATMIICGDFDIDTVTPLVEKYLGSIKKGKKPFTAKYEDPEIVPGKVTEDFKMDMQTPKVTVIEVFQTKLPEFKVIDKVALSAATYILDMRYTKSLREDEGGTYGASAYGSVTSEPKPEALIQVYFDTKPVAADKLISLSLEGLNALAAEGPTADEFDMAMKNLHKNLPESRITNGWWMNSLKFMDLHSVDFDKEYESALENLKPADVQNILKTILASGTVKTVIMRPGVTAEAE